jgi:hypothetical protein
MIMAKLPLSDSFAMIIATVGHPPAASGRMMAW